MPLWGALLAVRSTAGKPVFLSTIE